jgi:hypothetical protein
MTLVVTCNGQWADVVGLPLAAISVVDLAIWDLIGKIRKEPIYKMIGGRTKKDIPLYLTGPKPEVAQKLGFWGGKVPLPHGPSDGHVGLKQNVEFLKAHREKVGPDFPIMVDCYMSLDVVSPSSLSVPFALYSSYFNTLPSRTCPLGNPTPLSFTSFSTRTPLTHSHTRSNWSKQ